MLKNTHFIYKSICKVFIKVWYDWHRCKKLWWKIFFRIEATGSLANFYCGKNVNLDVPVRIAGGSGTLRIGTAVWFGWSAAPKMGNGAILLQPRSLESIITIGANTIMSNNVSIVAMGKISIGEHCLIGDMAQIFDCDFHELNPNKRFSGVGPIEPVSIGDNVWIGSHVIILRGVEIGNNSVIGAGSVVTKSIPPNSLAAGVPARVVCML